MTSWYITSRIPLVLKKISVQLWLKVFYHDFLVSFVSFKKHLLRLETSEIKNVNTKATNNGWVSINKIDANKPHYKHYMAFIKPIFLCVG